MQELVQQAQSRILEKLQEDGVQIIDLGVDIAAHVFDYQFGTTGNWRPFGTSDRVAVILDKTSGTIGDDPDMVFSQAQDGAGTGSKPLTVTSYWSKDAVNLLLDPAPPLAETTFAATDTVTFTGMGARELIAIFEILKTDLDQAGGFDYYRVDFPSAGANSQPAAALAISGDPATEGVLRYQDMRIGLYTAPLPEIPTVVLGDITEPTWTGYTRKTFTSWLTGTRSGGNRFLATGSVQWQATALPGGPSPTFGAFLMNVVTGELVSFWPFPSMLNIDHIGQIIEVSPEFGLNDQNPQDLIPSTS